MATEQYLEITGIQGESAAPDLRGAIPVISWRLAVTAADPGAPAVFAPFSLTKRVDSSTPLLLALAARGAVAPQARLVVRSAGLRDPRVIVDLRGVRVSAVSAEYARDETDLLETVQLTYERIWFGGAVVDRRGSSEQTNWFAWDVAANRPAG